jgi:hypothetical protein
MKLHFLYPLCWFWLVPAAFFGQESDTVLYHGWADDMFPVDMNLYFQADKSIVSGWYSFPQSGLTFELEGYVQDDTIRMIEMDGSSHVSGYFELAQARHSLMGNWKNVDKEITSHFEMWDPRHFYISPSCKSNKWIKRIRAIVKDDIYEFTIIRGPQNMVSGYMYRNGLERFALDGNCLSRDCVEIRITAARAGMQFRFLFDPYLPLRMERIVKGVKEEAEETETEDTWSLLCFTQISYASSFDAVYPRINDAFEAQLLASFERWKTLIEYQDAMEYGDPVQHPSHRWQNRNYSWLEIDHIDDHFISGVIEWIGPFGSIDGFAFNYDVEKNRFLNVGSMFKKNFELNLVRKIQNDDSWKYVTVRKEGLCLRTAFDVVYGTKIHIIPFDKNRKFFKKQLEDLVKYTGD